MIHIAILIPTLERIGGAESQVLLLAEGLALRGWRVTLIALSGKMTPDSGKNWEGISACTRQRLTEAGVSMVSLGMRKAWVDPRGWFRYLRWKRQFRPDIVHAHLAHAVWFARYIRCLSPVRLVVDTIHTTRAAVRRDRFVTRLSNWLSDRTTCVSEAVAERVLCTSTIPSHKLSVLANGILLGPERQDPMESDRQQFSDKATFRWLAVGRLAPVKDYPTLLQSFKMVIARVRREGGAAPLLTILGSGPEEAALREFALRLGIAESVNFAGFQCDVQLFLAAADAFVLSSLWEGLPIGVLEAQAAGIPVVATDGPGTAHAMTDGETGFLVPVGNIDLLGEAMAKLMEMPSCQRRHMGKAGRIFVADHFSLEATLDQWENFHHELLEGHPEPTRWARRGIKRKASGAFLKAVYASGIVRGAADLEGPIHPQATPKGRVPGK